jgi:hypothetical protein
MERSNSTLQRSEFAIPILTKNVFVGIPLWRNLHCFFFSFESFVTRYKLQKTSLKLISVSISGNKFKTYDELKNQLNCKLNFLKYFSLISMIKSKNVTNITNAEYRSHLINTILNSNSMISNEHSLTFVINTIFAIFNSIGISKISSNQVCIRFKLHWKI